MFYREIGPSAELAPFILSFWEFAVPYDTVSPVNHEIFPDGCVSLFYYRNLIRGIHHIGLTGLQLESITKTVGAGDMFWGIRISPAACAAILRASPSRMIGKLVPNAAGFPHLTNQLKGKLTKAVDFEEAVSIFEDVMKKLAASTCSDRTIADAVIMIDESHGEIRIDELAVRLGMSTRQLQRRFKTSSGLSPKQFARIRRIRATAVILAENKQVNWADRAAEMGFADQSHLAHEFVSVTKRTPRSFAKKVAGIEHGNLVK